MNIKIDHEGLRYVLCVGFRRMLGSSKVCRPESFLFFAPEMPDERDQEAVMVAIADSLVDRMRGMWGLMAARRLSFTEAGDTLMADSDWAGVFGKEGFPVLRDQLKRIRQRLPGQSNGHRANWRDFVVGRLFPPEEGAGKRP